MNEIEEYGRPSCSPATVIDEFDEPSAIALSGSACASDMMIAGTIMCPIMPRPPLAAGKRGLKIEPSGAEVLIMRKLPSLFGTSGESSAFTAYAEYAKQ